MLENELTLKHGVEFWIKRDDLLHPLVSGNKWRKLKYNLDFVSKNRLAGIISFGGAYSNHVYALSAACFLLKIPLKLYIRGEPPLSLGYTLRSAIEHEAELHFIDRNSYKKMTAEIADEDQTVRDGWLIIPEGGSNSLGMKGMAELLAELPFEPEHMIISAGTGGSLCGLAKAGYHQNTIYHGICVLKAQGLLDSLISSQLNGIPVKVKMHYNYHLGGYAKTSEEVVEVINRYVDEHGILLDPVYTSKAALAVEHLIATKVIGRGERAILIHTGGLQGLWGMQDRLLKMGLNNAIFDRL